MQLTTDQPRERPASKCIALTPTLFLVLTFCENNRDPIYEIDFSSKVGPEWTQVKCSQATQSMLGLYFCYKTEPSLSSGPICDIHMLNIERKSRFGQSKQILNVPHGYKIVSHQLPFGYLIFRKVKSKVEQTFKATLAEKFCSEKGQRINLSQLPLFCFPDGIKIVREIRGFATFNFIFTLETAERIYVTCLVFKQNIDQKQRQKLEVMTNDQFFYEKALCLASSYCYTDQFAECLQHLYRLSLSKSEIPFWKVAQKFVEEALFPEPEQIGKVGLKYNYNGNQITFPTSKNYPFVSERALYTIFKFMRADNIVSVFEALLLEKKVFFVSQSKTILGYATQAFLGLLFPFKWEQVLIPILPSNLKEYLTAPVPLVAGISPSLVDSSIESDSVIVYLDKNQVLNDEDNPPLPQKLLKQLMKRLERLQVYDPEEVAQFLQNPESTYLFKMQQVQDPQFHGHLVRDAFFDFLLTLMRNYRRFWQKPKSTNHDMSSCELDNPPLLHEIFRLQDFLSDLGMTKIGSFGYKFTESSIFTAFIEKKYKNPNDSEVTFFDDCLDRKKTKKQTVFITQIENSSYQTIPNPSPQPEDKEKGPFFYNRFPSLLKNPIEVSYELIGMIVNDEHEEQNQIINTIDEEFYSNNDFYQPFECEDALEKKMKTLLLNKNKKHFPQQNSQDQSSLLNWFIGIYCKQCLEIENLIEAWPQIAQQGKFTLLSKLEYLKGSKKFQSNQTIGVHENNDFQILIRKEVKVFFVTLGSGSAFGHRANGIVVEVGSCRIKNLLNAIIPKQCSYVIDYCQKQAARDLRASSFKKSCYQTWTIESVFSFRDWLCHQKQFGTGITHD